MKHKLLILMIWVASSLAVSAQKKFEVDTIPLRSGNLEITFIGHASLIFKYQDRYIYVDPVMQLADYSKFPKADAILVTHDHGDHLDPVAIEYLTKPETQIFLTKLCFNKLKKGEICESNTFFLTSGISVETVAAYNISKLRGNGIPYHPKNDGLGYVLVFDNVRVYVAGDTELTDEMVNLKNIDIAFLPIGLPYTMEPQLAVEAAKLLKVKIFYPYHFNNSNPDEVFRSLIGSPIEVRVRSMK